MRRVARETRLHQGFVGDVLTATLQTITDALARGERVTLPGFGTFYTADRQESTVRNIRTGEEMWVPARRVAAFRVGELLKTAVRKKKK